MWVATRKWVPGPSPLDRENAICKIVITAMTSVSLPTNIISND